MGNGCAGVAVDTVELWRAWKVGTLPRGVSVAYVLEDGEELTETKSVMVRSVDKWGTWRERVVDVAWREVEGCGRVMCGVDGRHDPVVLVVGVEYLP